MFTVPTSSSSLADIRNIIVISGGGGENNSNSNSNSMALAPPPPPFNQRLQTFKRSFNKKTSFKKMKSPQPQTDVVIFNKENNVDPRNNEVRIYNEEIFITLKVFEPQTHRDCILR